MPDIQNEKTDAKTYRMKMPQLIFYGIFIAVCQAILFLQKEHDKFFLIVSCFWLLFSVIIWLLIRRNVLTLNDTEIIMGSFVGGHRLRLSKMEMVLEENGGPYLKEAGNTMGLYLQAMPIEMLLEVFRRIPLSTPIVGGIFSNYPPERMAAMAYDKLNSSTAWESLMARQILVFLSGQNPEYFLPGENPEKILHWKKWLKNEYAESFNVLVYQKERKAIYRFSTILLILTGVVFSVFLLCGWPLWIAGLILFMPVMLTGVFILFPLIKFKSLARRFNAN